MCKAKKFEMQQMQKSDALPVIMSNEDNKIDEEEVEKQTCKY